MDSVAEITLDATQTVGAAALALAVGLFLSKKIKFIHRYNLPSSVIGGLVFCIILLSLRKSDTLIVQFTKSFEPILMTTFFASIGFAASFDTMKRGGKGVVAFLLLSTVFTLLQNALGIGASLALGLHPLFGVLTGSVALAGGPGTAMAFAPSFQEAGVDNASLAAISAALSGIVIGGLIGTPVATHIIQKFNLKAKKHPIKTDLQTKLEFSDEGTMTFENLGQELMKTLILLCVVLWAGTLFSSLFTSLEIKLPGYIGAMIAAAIVRNLGNYFPLFKVNMAIIDDLGNVALSLFLSLALMSLELWKIADVATALIVIITLQTILIVIGTYFIVYKFSGRDYEAAVISSGFIGFMMGTTANAMSNMRSLVDRYGPAPKAFIVVPIVGACFIDFINATIILALINYFH